MKEVIIMKNEASQEFKTTFSERLGSAMNLRNCTQEELAKAIGTKQTTVFRWLSGEYCPNLEMVAKCAKYLDVKIDYLSGLENNSQTYTNEEIANKTNLSTTAVHNLIMYKEKNNGLSELLENDWWGLVVLAEMSQYYEYYPDKNGNVIRNGYEMPLKVAKASSAYNITEAILKSREALDEQLFRQRSNKEIKALIEEIKKEAKHGNNPKKKK